MKSELTALYDVADDGEASILDDLRQRAGLTKDCSGHWTTTPDHPRCAVCGANPWQAGASS